MTNREKLAAAVALIREVQSGLDTGTRHCDSCERTVHLSNPEFLAADSLGAAITKLDRLLGNPTMRPWLDRGAP